MALLLFHGADPTVRNWDGSTPLDLCGDPTIQSVFNAWSACHKTLMNWQGPELRLDWVIQELTEVMDYWSFLKITQDTEFHRDFIAVVSLLSEIQLLCENGTEEAPKSGASDEMPSVATDYAFGDEPNERFQKVFEANRQIRYRSSVPVEEKYNLNVSMREVFDDQDRIFSSIAETIIRERYRMDASDNDSDRNVSWLNFESYD